MAHPLEAIDGPPDGVRWPPHDPLAAEDAAAFALVTVAQVLGRAGKALKVEAELVACLDVHQRHQNRHR